MNTVAKSITVLHTAAHFAAAGASGSSSGGCGEFIGHAHRRQVTAYFRSHALASRRQMGNGVLCFFSSLFFILFFFASMPRAHSAFGDLHLYHVCASISASCCAGFKRMSRSWWSVYPFLRSVGSSGKRFWGWFNGRSAAWLGLCEDGGTSCHAWVVMSWSIQSEVSTCLCLVSAGLGLDTGAFALEPGMNVTAHVIASRGRRAPRVACYQVHFSKNILGAS